MNKPLYQTAKTQEIDDLAAAHLQISSFELMRRAGQAIFQHIKPQQSLLVVTGGGNNGGDGYIIAELARQRGQAVAVWAVKPIEALIGDAQLAASAYQGKVLDSTPEATFDVIVDALLGAGFKGAVRSDIIPVIDWINSQASEVLSVDLPSGLNGDTGQALPVAVKANLTVSVLVLNTGLFTADAQDHVGDWVLETLGVPQTALAAIQEDACLTDQTTLQQIVNGRTNNSHKGQFGHVMAVGGQPGMLGAVVLAGYAALKSGAGLVTVKTAGEHVGLIPVRHPELMTESVDGVKMPEQALVQVAGMGLGRSGWSESVYQQLLQETGPVVLDADGLFWMRTTGLAPEGLAVITPHPKEAADLLNTTVQEVQANRWEAVQKLAQKHGCVVILKGSGTLISDGTDVWCCPYGNHHLATAGSGDVLAGIIAGLMAQGFHSLEAATMATTWHALAGDCAPQGLCLTASEIIEQLPEVIYGRI